MQTNINNIQTHTKNKMLLLNYANVIKQSKKLTISSNVNKQVDL